MTFSQIRKCALFLSFFLFAAQNASASLFPSCSKEVSTHFSKFKIYDEAYAEIQHERPHLSAKEFQQKVLSNVSERMLFLLLAKKEIGHGVTCLTDGGHLINRYILRQEEKIAAAQVSSAFDEVYQVYSEHMQHSTYDECSTQINHIVDSILSYEASYPDAMTRKEKLFNLVQRKMLLDVLSGLHIDCSHNKEDSSYRISEKHFIRVSLQKVRREIEVL